MALFSSVHSYPAGNSVAEAAGRVAEAFPREDKYSEAAEVVLRACFGDGIRNAVRSAGDTSRSDLGKVSESHDETEIRKADAHVLANDRGGVSSETPQVEDDGDLSQKFYDAGGTVRLRGACSQTRYGL